MIAFCFLIIDDLPHRKVWEAYLKDSPHKVYVHSKFKNPKNLPSKAILTQSSGVLQPEHGDIRCVMALLELLREGLKGNSSHFIFLSESCVPISPLKEVERGLNKARSKSIVGVTHHHPQSEHGHRRTFVDGLEIPKEAWIFHPTWIILCREHVRAIVESKDLHQWLRAFRKVPFVDEHFLGTFLLHLLGSQEFHDQVIVDKKTFVNWKEYERIDGKNRPKTYRKWDPTLVRDLRNQNYWFGRKFKCKVDIEGVKSSKRLPLWGIFTIIFGCIGLLILIIVFLKKKSKVTK